MNINNLNEVILTLSKMFGKIDHYHIISTGWKEGTRQSSLFFKTTKGKFVYHPKNETSNIAHYKQKLDEKNIPRIISSPIVEITERGFVTKFIEGKVLDNLPITDIFAIAQLQAKFHQVSSYNLNYWNEKIAQVHTYLLQNVLVKKEELHYPKFSSYGLIHGDYSQSNLVKTTQGLVSIDLEHILEGPIAFDLTRPLLRICRNKSEQLNYLNCYFQGRQRLSQEELSFGRSTFFLIQAYDRHKLRHLIEAQLSLKKFREAFK